MGQLAHRSSKNAVLLLHALNFTGTLVQRLDEHIILTWYYPLRTFDDFQRPSRPESAQDSSLASRLNSRCSHALAANQSRLTVISDTPSTCAASAALSPPKYRISTI